jgi:hypothetical protein
VRDSWFQQVIAMMVFLALVPCWSCRKLVGSACPAKGMESAIEQGEVQGETKREGA